MRGYIMGLEIMHPSSPCLADKNINQALMTACAADDEIKAQALLAIGANPLARDPNQRTALHHVARGSTARCVDVLVRHGARVEAVDVEGKTALHHAAELGNEQACRELLGAGAPADGLGVAGLAPLHLAAENDHHLVCRTLVQAGADINQLTSGALKPGPLTALELAARRQHKHAFLWLMALGADPSLVRHAKVLPVMFQHGLNYPLHMAAAQGYTDLCMAFLENGFNPDIRNGSRLVAADVAARHGREETMAALRAWNARHHARAALEAADLLAIGERYRATLA